MFKFQTLALFLIIYCSSSQNTLCNTKAEDNLCCTIKEISYVVIKGCTTYFEGTCTTQNCSIDVCQKSTTPQCTTCDTDYLLQTMYCYAKIVDCETQSGKTCSKCISPKLLANSGTLCVAEISNCDFYESQNTCKTCKQGFHLSQNLGKCFINVANCLSHVDDKCESCNEQFSLYSLDGLNFCYTNILNCQNTFYKPLIQKSYCGTCSSGFELTEDGLCKLIVSNCALFNNNQSKCLKCSNGFTLISDSQCTGCAIPYCLSCQNSSLFGLQCLSCQSGFQLGTNQQSCIANCQQSDNLNSCVSCSNGKCNSCALGYYINESGNCQQCNGKFANCDSCAINQCIQCSLGYYYDFTNKYCYKCSQSMNGCEICVDKTTCQKCNSVGFALQNNQCISCGSQVQNCSQCSLIQAEVICNTCLSGYIKANENYKTYCLSCQTQFKLPYCLDCIIAPTQCISCMDGYYLQISTNSNDCVQCPVNCTKCTDSSTCTACSSNYILQNTASCSADLSNFILTETTSSESALAYANILLTEKSLGPYSTIGTLNSKGYFCQSDKNCNMNGRCLLTECKCIKDISGSRCQFDKNEDFSSLHSNILSYLNTQTTIDDNQIELLKLVSDTSFSISEQNVQRIQTILVNSINQGFNYRYYSIIGNLLKNIQAKETIANQKLSNLDAIQLSVLNKQSNNLLISETIATSGPFHKQIIGKFDLKDPDSLAKFKSQYVKSITVCDNEKKYLTPDIYLTDTFVTQLTALQGNASMPILFNQMHLYYTPYRSSGQNINSSISRIQFIKNFEYLNISGIQATIVVPKIDQQFSDVNEQNVCVVWNNEKQIWEQTSSTLLRCRYYTVCAVTHFSDFATYIQVNQTKTNTRPTLASYLETDFQILLAVQNCAFAISCSLIGLFIVLTIFFCFMHKYPRSKQHRMNTYDGVVQSGLHLEPIPDTERAQEIRPIKRIANKNLWTVYPMNAILQTKSLDYQMQKMSLFILQLQMYVTFTSIYLAIPFSFGRLTAYYILAIIQTWITNYIYGGLAMAFRRKSRKQVFGCYWMLFVIIFFGNMIIGIWRMYGLSLSFDMYLLAGVGIEFLLDAVFCDLFVTYFYQNLFIDDIFGIWKIIKYRGYFE